MPKPSTPSEDAERLCGSRGAASKRGKGMMSRSNAEGPIESTDCSKSSVKSYRPLQTAAEGPKVSSQDTEMLVFCIDAIAMEICLS